MWDWFGRIEYILTVYLVFKLFLLNIYDEIIGESSMIFLFHIYFYICIRKSIFLWHDFMKYCIYVCYPALV